MRYLQVNSDADVAKVLNTYPGSARNQVLGLRRLVIETACETEGVEHLEETLKWGEPSYLTENGSTVRIAWKERTPEQVAIYFKCTSKLVPTFKAVYNEIFRFEGTRAIVFDLHGTVPEIELKQCIGAALTYHKVKQLPMLGLQHP